MPPRKLVDYSQLDRLSQMVSGALDERRRMELTKLDLLARRRELERERARQEAIGDITKRVSQQITSGKEVERPIGRQLGDRFDMTVKEKKPLTTSEEDAILLPATTELLGYGEQGIKAADVLENIIRRRRADAGAGMYSFGSPVPSKTGTYFAPRENRQTGQVEWYDTKVPITEEKLHPGSGADSRAEEKNLETLRQRAIAGRTAVKQLETQYTPAALKEAKELISQYKDYLDKPEALNAIILDPTIGEKMRLGRDYVKSLTNYQSALEQLQGLGKTIDEEGRLINYDAKKNPRVIDMRDPNNW
jgi:hypothetical protein